MLVSRFQTTRLAIFCGKPTRRAGRRGRGRAGLAREAWPLHVRCRRVRRRPPVPPVPACSWPRCLGPARESGGCRALSDSPCQRGGGVRGRGQRRAISGFCDSLSVSLGWAPPPGHSGPGSLAGAGVGEWPSAPGVLLGGLAVCHDDHSPAPLLEPPGDPLWLPTEFSEVKCSFWGPRRFLPVSRVPALRLAVCQNCRVSVSGVCGPLDVRSGLAGPGRDAPGAPPSRDCGAGPGPETLLITL